eukprot:2192816-Rhodomonas_salina.1
MSSNNFRYDDYPRNTKYVSAEGSKYDPPKATYVYPAQPASATQPRSDTRRVTLEDRGLGRAGQPLYSSASALPSKSSPVVQRIPYTGQRSTTVRIPYNRPETQVREPVREPVQYQPYQPVSEPISAPRDNTQNVKMAEDNSLLVQVCCLVSLRLLCMIPDTDATLCVPRTFLTAPTPRLTSPAIRWTGECGWLVSSADSRRTCHKMHCTDTADGDRLPELADPPHRSVQDAQRRAQQVSYGFFPRALQKTQQN